MNIEDLGLEGDQLEFVKKLAESAKSNNNNELQEKLDKALTSIEKLEQNNFNLLNEKKKKEEDLRLEREKALKGDELETAITERLEAQYKEQIEGLTNRNQKLVSDSLNSNKNSIVSELTGLFKDPELYKLPFQNMVSLEMADDGSIKTTFTDFDGKPVTDNQDTFKAWISEQPQLSKNIVVSQAAGSNAEGSGGSAGSHSEIPKTLADCNGDKKLEEAYFQNQLNQATG